MVDKLFLPSVSLENKCFNEIIKTDTISWRGKNEDKVN